MFDGLGVCWEHSLWKTDKIPDAKDFLGILNKRVTVSQCCYCLVPSKKKRKFSRFVDCRSGNSFNQICAWNGVFAQDVFQDVTPGE